MGNWYATLGELKRHVNPPITDTADDEMLCLWLDDVSRLIDGLLYGQGHFYCVQATRRFTAHGYDHVRTPQLLAVTSVKTDDNADRTYATTWAATDWEFYPYDAPQHSPPWPYEGVRITPNGNYMFPWVPPSGSVMHNGIDLPYAYRLPFIEDGIQIVGKYGFYDVRKNLTTLSAAITTTSQATFTCPTGLVERGHTLHIDSEDLFVTSVAAGATDTVSVDRGVNGSTAATHLIGATVQAYTYPLIHTACLMQAYRSARRGDTPFGTAGQGAGQGLTLIRELDPDVAQRITAVRVPVFA